MAAHNFIFVTVLICISSIFVNSQENHAGENLKKCYLLDKTKFESCILKFWNELFPQMKTGVPQLKVPKADPFTIDAIDWHEVGPAIQVVGKFTNFKISGVSNSICTSVKLNKQARVIHYNLTTPSIDILTDYTINGSIMMMPLNGKGKIRVNASDIITIGRYDVVQSGTGVRMANMDIDLIIKNAYFKFINAGNDPIWEAVNKIINDNTQMLFEEIKPTINKKLAAIIMQFAAEAYSKIPAEAFIS